MSRSRSAIACIAMVAGMVAAGVAACSDSPTGDAPALDGVFDLVTVNGEPLPYTYHIDTQTGMPRSYAVSRNELTFGRYDRVTRVERLTIDFAGEDTTVLTYRVEGDQLMINYPVNGAYPQYSDTGTIAGTTLYLRVKHVRDRRNVNLDYFYSMR